MKEQNGNLSTVDATENAEKSVEKKSFWKINREMLPYKLHFFLLEFGLGTVIPFQSAFGITVLGLSAGNIAACYTAVQVTIFVSKPVIGYIADYFNKLKAVIIALSVLQFVFSFFIIIIPNTDMPGINVERFKNGFENNTNCQICFSSDTLQSVTSERYMDEELFMIVSSCFGGIEAEIISINCSSDYFTSTESNYDRFQIKRITHSSCCKDILLHKIHTEDVDVNETFSDILHIRTSPISFVCLLPAEGMSALMNLSIHDLNNYCYALSDELDMKLEYFLTKTAITRVHCPNLQEMIPLQQTNDHSVGIANFKTYQFWLFAVFLVLSSALSSSEFTMSDTACYESIQDNDYGQQKVWGPIGWGLAATLAGYLNDYTDSYMASCCICAAFAALRIWNLSRMNLIKPDFSQNIQNDMKKILSSVEFLCFQAGVLMNGMFTGIIWYYLSWFIVSIGGSKFIIGLVHAIENFLGETPGMYFSGWLINKLGHFNLVSLALICHGIRFFLYSYIYNPWWILPIECLHGLTFASFYAAMTSYAKLNSKPGTEATTQAILSTTFEALGCGLGCLIAGICFELYGGHATFYYASFLCVIATMINLLSTIVIRCCKGSQDITKSTASTENC